MGIPEQPCPSYMMNKGRSEPLPTPKVRRGGPLKGKNVLRLVNHDMIRDLLIPSHCPNTYQAVLHKCDYERIKGNAKTLTIPEKIALLENDEQKRKKKLQDSINRRMHLQAHDNERFQQGIKCDAATEASKHYAIARAYELRQEQDDDMKQFNRVVLGTKCHAIRDAQIAEKKLIEKELKEEEQRLDDMMEQNRRLRIQMAEEERQRKTLKKQEYICHLKDQIKENEITKLLTAEDMEDESRRLQEASLQLQIEEIEKRKQRLIQQERIRQDLNEVNKQLKHFRDLEQQEEKINELKIHEFHRQKAEEEEAREQELRAQALAHNQGFAKLWAQQEKEHDAQQRLDELHEQRVQDEIERQWRRKEQEAARKRHEACERLRKGREAQVQDTRRMRALEMAREKQEFEEVLRAQMQQAQKEEEKQRKRQEESDAHLRAILTQIQEKECQKIKEKQNLYEEGTAIKLQEDCHKKQIKELMQKKVAGLRAHNVPDVYVKEVERHMNKKKKEQLP